MVGECIRGRELRRRRMGEELMDEPGVDMRISGWVRVRRTGVEVPGVGRTARVATRGGDGVRTSSASSDNDGCESAVKSMTDGGGRLLGPAAEGRTIDFGVAYFCAAGVDVDAA